MNKSKEVHTVELKFSAQDEEMIHSNASSKKGNLMSYSRLRFSQNISGFHNRFIHEGMQNIFKVMFTFES